MPVAFSRIAKNYGEKPWEKWDLPFVTFYRVMQMFSSNNYCIISLVVNFEAYVL